MITREFADTVAVVKLHHGKANALDLEFLERIRDEFRELAQEGRPVVLTGTGKIFTAGVDLYRFIEGGSDAVESFLEALEQAFQALFFYPRPLVSAINGHAIAGGCVVACTADYRIMARSTGQIGVPELQVGVPFPTLVLEILRFAIPASFRSTVCFRGLNYTPEEAVKVGLVDELSDDDLLLDRAIEEATELGSRPVSAFELTKRQLRQPVLEAWDRYARIEREVRALWKSPQTIAAIKAYVDKTFGK